MMGLKQFGPMIEIDALKEKINEPLEELKLEENPYKKMIPQSIINKYGHIRL